MTKRQRDLDPDIQRAAVAVRELRRGSGMQALRDHIYGADGLDLGQHDALDVVVTIGEARMGDLAAALRVDASTATRTVGRLEADGLVERRRGDDDGRAVVVVATPAGVRLHDQLRQRARSALEELYAEFSVAEVRTLADLLERLVRSVDRVVKLPRPDRSD